MVSVAPFFDSQFHSVHMIYYSMYGSKHIIVLACYYYTVVSGHT